MDEHDEIMAFCVEQRSRRRLSQTVSNRRSQTDYLLSQTDKFVLPAAKLPLFRVSVWGIVDDTGIGSVFTLHTPNKAKAQKGPPKPTMFTVDISSGEVEITWDGTGGNILSNKKVQRTIKCDKKSWAVYTTDFPKHLVLFNVKDDSDKSGERWILAIIMSERGTVERFARVRDAVNNLREGKPVPGVYGSERQVGDSVPADGIYYAR